MSISLTLYKWREKDSWLNFVCLMIFYQFLSFWLSWAVTYLCSQSYCFEQIWFRPFRSNHSPDKSFHWKLALLAVGLHSFCFISNGPTSLFILSVAYKPLLIKQNECRSILGLNLRLPNRRSFLVATYCLKKLHFQFATEALVLIKYLILSP